MANDDDITTEVGNEFLGFSLVLDLLRFNTRESWAGRLGALVRNLRTMKVVSK